MEDILPIPPPVGPAHQMFLSAPWTRRIQHLCSRRIRLLYIHHPAICSLCSRGHCWPNLSIRDNSNLPENPSPLPSKWSSILARSLLRYPATEHSSIETVR